MTFARRALHNAGARAVTVARCDRRECVGITVAVGPPLPTSVWRGPDEHSSHETNLLPFPLPVLSLELDVPRGGTLRGLRPAMPSGREQLVIWWAPRVFRRGHGARENLSSTLPEPACARRPLLSAIIERPEGAIALRAHWPSRADAWSGSSSTESQDRDRRCPKKGSPLFPTAPKAGPLAVGGSSALRPRPEQESFPEAEAGPMQTWPAAMAEGSTVLGLRGASGLATWW